MVTYTHILVAEIESTNANWHDVADELANAAVDADNSIQELKVFQMRDQGKHEASR